MNGEILYRQQYEIKGKDFTHAGKASTQVKAVLKEIGIEPQIVRRTAIAAYEAEMNVVMYAEYGWLEFSLDKEKIQLLVSDKGPGIPDIELAMQEGYSTASTEMREMGFGAGMGLPNIKKNSDSFDIVSEVGKGTQLKIIIYHNKKAE